MTELSDMLLKKIREKNVFGPDERRKKLMDAIKERIGDGEVAASDIYVEGYDDVEIYQALMILELQGEIEQTDFHTIVREDGGLISVGVYKRT